MSWQLNAMVWSAPEGTSKIITGKIYSILMVETGYLKTKQTKKTDEGAYHTMDLVSCLFLIISEVRAGRVASPLCQKKKQKKTTCDT